MKKEKNEKFCETLSLLREERELNMKEVAEGIGINPTTYRKYENGDLEPSFATLSSLAEFFNVSTDYLLGRPEAEPPKDPVDSLATVDEMEADLLKRWMDLDTDARNAVLQMLRDIVHDDDARKKASIAVTKPPPFKVLVHTSKVSAGTGYDLDDDHWAKKEVVDCPEAREADFAIEVDGDSMKPDYNDGDFVYVVFDPDVPIGKVGIFTDVDKGYIKMRGKDRLISINPDYDDIPLTAEMRCIGRVIGIAEPATT